MLTFTYLLFKGVNKLYRRYHKDEIKTAAGKF